MGFRRYIRELLGIDPNEWKCNNNCNSFCFNNRLADFEIDKNDVSILRITLKPEYNNKLNSGRELAVCIGGYIINYLMKLGKRANINNIPSTICFTNSKEFPNSLFIYVYAYRIILNSIYEYLMTNDDCFPATIYAHIFNITCEDDEELSEIIQKKLEDFKIDFKEVYQLDKHLYQ